MSTSLSPVHRHLADGHFLPQSEKKCACATISIPTRDLHKMTLKLLTRLTDALKDAWEHKWSQTAINERLANPDESVARGPNTPRWVPSGGARRTSGAPKRR